MLCKGVENEDDVIVINTDDESDDNESNFSAGFSEEDLELNHRYSKEFFYHHDVVKTKRLPTVVLNKLGTCIENDNIEYLQFGKWKLCEALVIKRFYLEGSVLDGRNRNKYNNVVCKILSLRFK